MDGDHGKEDLPNPFRKMATSAISALFRGVPFTVFIWPLLLQGNNNSWSSVCLFCFETGCFFVGHNGLKLELCRPHLLCAEALVCGSPA